MVDSDCFKEKVMAKSNVQVSAVALSEIIEMALSDHIGFDTIKSQYGLNADQVKAVMRSHLKPGSYRAWRKRVRTFSDRRDHYK
jgi:uncharacterized protein (TIGR03643 family)